MVVSKVEFNEALVEINASYAKVWKKVEELEQELKELKAQPKAKTPAKATANG